jgi:transcriptional antiterminator NusG
VTAAASTHDTDEGSERHVTEREADQLDGAAEAADTVEEPAEATDAELTDADDTTDAEDTAGEDVDVQENDVQDDAAENTEPAAAAVEEEVDPVEEMRAALRRAPGDWYVVHSYAGYENKVKTNLETRIQTLDISTPGRSNGMAPSRSATSSTSSVGAKSNSASGSAKFRISQALETRSTRTF